MKNNQLQALTKKWQKILRLQDWTISVFFACTTKSSSGEWDLGNCECSPYRKTADINILAPKLWKDNSRTPGYRGLNKEIELTLIHEMIHCHFQFLKMPKERSQDELILENGVESLAVAFLENF